MRSPQNMLGYWNLPEETAKSFADDGWFRTGDAGFLDADGYVYIHDRVKDMIVSGGENVYPAEVENVLMAHPSIADAAVIGIPDDKWGETPKAMVVRKPDTDISEADIISFCRQQLAKFKCPTSVDRRALPRNPANDPKKISARRSDRRDHFVSYEMPLIDPMTPSGRHRGAARTSTRPADVAAVAFAGFVDRLRGWRESPERSTCRRSSLWRRQVHATRRSRPARSAPTRDRAQRIGLTYVDDIRRVV